MISKELEEKLRKDFVRAVANHYSIKLSAQELREIEDYWIARLPSTLEEERSRLLKGVEEKKNVLKFAMNQAGILKEWKNGAAREIDVLSDVQKLINEGK